MKSFRPASVFPALFLAGLTFGVNPSGAAEPTVAVGETIDVEIKLVPFYAVDEEGKPVFDLKQDEIELRLDGKTLPVDTLDAFQKGNAADPAIGKQESLPSKGKGPRRHVVLFFDVAFSSPRGFEQGRSFAERMLGDVPDGDLLYLVTHEYTSGLQQRLGPVAANASGKSKMLAELQKLKPEIRQISAETEFSMELTGRGSTKRNVPSGQNMLVDEPLREMSQTQLEGTARSLAQSMQALADQFQRIRDPKLLVFLSQGIDPTLYWMGSDTKLAGVSETNLIVKGEQYTGLHKLYEKPLQQLADSGTMSLFVNLDDQAKRQRVNDSSMEHMARASGGLYLGGVDPAPLRERFAGSTSAYYEAGFYLNEQNQKPSRGKVEVVVNRPGVRTWSAGAIKTRETWRALTQEARRLLIVDLIEGEAHSRKPVRLTLENLPGNVKGGKTAAGTTLLHFQAGWPQELAGRKIDLYNVLLEQAPSGCAKRAPLRRQGRNADRRRRRGRDGAARESQLRLGNRGRRTCQRPRLVSALPAPGPTVGVCTRPYGRGCFRCGLTNISSQFPRRRPWRAARSRLRSSLAGAQRTALKLRGARTAHRSA